MIKYLAGIFDAEGYVRIRKTKSKSGKKYSYTPEVRIYMCDRRIVDEFAKLYKLEVKSSHRGNNRKTAYSVGLGVKKLRESSFIEDVLPFLNEKRLQLNEVKQLINGTKEKEQCYQDYMVYKKTFDHKIHGVLSYEYIAGVLDGDGWFTMFSASKNKEAVYNKFALGLEQRYKPMVEYLLKFGGNVRSKEVKDRINHIETHEWKTYNSNEILVLAKEIHPFLIEKKETCKRFIEYITKYEEFRSYSKKALKEHQCF